MDKRTITVHTWLRCRSTSIQALYIKSTCGEAGVPDTMFNRLKVAAY